MRKACEEIRCNSNSCNSGFEREDRKVKRPFLPMRKTKPFQKTPELEGT